MSDILYTCAMCNSKNIEEQVERIQGITVDNESYEIDEHFMVCADCEFEFVTSEQSVINLRLQEESISNSKDKTWFILLPQNTANATTLSLKFSVEAFTKLDGYSHKVCAQGAKGKFYRSYVKPLKSKYVNEYVKFEQPKHELSSLYKMKKVNFNEYHPA